MLVSCRDGMTLAVAAGKHPIRVGNDEEDEEKEAQHGCRRVSFFVAHFVVDVQTNS